MEHNKTPFRFKHIREKNYDSSHPLYDVMKTICNPDGENSGHTAEYKGMTFQLYMCRDTYYDEQGIPQREVSVLGLDQQEDSWHVYRYNAEELAERAKKMEQKEFKPHTVDYDYKDGRLSWIFRRDYNERRELIHMEDFRAVPLCCELYFCCFTTIKALLTSFCRKTRSLSQQVPQSFPRFLVFSPESPYLCIRIQT